MRKLITKYLNNKKSFVFVSPHLDDAILSAGGLISHLAKKGEIKVVNVFTKGASESMTISARMFLKQCGYNNSNQLYADRVSEDAVALGKINLVPKNLGYTDALWRKKADSNFLGKLIPEFAHIYPTYRFHITSGHVSNYDIGLQKEIEKKLCQLVVDKKSIVFCPLGLGNHVDHILVRNACANVFTNVVYWSDFPYSGKSSDLPGFVNEDNLKKFVFIFNKNSKRKLIISYKSQVKALFGGGKITLPLESFFAGMN